jgi:hypothetical protein
MILIQAVSQYAKAEKLVHTITEADTQWVALLEESGFTVSFTNLPSHIQTHEEHAATILDEYFDSYLPPNERLN